MQSNLEEIINKYGDTVYRLALSVTKNREDAADISQEVFIRYIRHAHKFAYNDDYLKAWLIRVTINQSRDLISSFGRKNVVGISDDNLAAVSFNTEESEIYEAVLNLPEKYRLVIYLYYYEGYSVRETASILRRSQGTVKWQLSRARELLKKSLEGAEIYVPENI